MSDRHRLPLLQFVEPLKILFPLIDKVMKESRSASIRSIARQMFWEVHCLLKTLPKIGGH
jgi:hypothetical protein